MSAKTSNGKEIRTKIGNLKKSKTLDGIKTTEGEWRSHTSKNVMHKKHNNNAKGVRSNDDVAR